MPPPGSTSRISTTVIHRHERLVLVRPLTTDHLIVHMGYPGPTIEAGEHAIEYSSAEYIGSGEFTVLRNGVQAMRIVQP
jgi:hypothetical protein